MNEKDISDSDSIKKKLLLASLFLTGFEMLKSSLIDDVKDFYITGFDEKGYLISSDYNNKVLSKADNHYLAHCLWLVEAKAITDDDVLELQKIREYRNTIAHRLANLLFSEEFNVDVTLLRKMKYYLNIIGRFWGQIEMETSTDFKGLKIDYNGIVSGKQMLFDYLISIVDEETAKTKM